MLSPSTSCEYLLIDKVTVLLFMLVVSDAIELAHFVRESVVFHCTPSKLHSTIKQKGNINDYLYGC